MELTGGAYLFAYLGFLLMVVVGWLIIPRASFVLTIAILVHKIGLINFESKPPVSFDVVTSLLLITIMVVIGLVIDIDILIAKLVRDD